MYPSIYLDITDSKSPVPLSSSDTTRTIKIYSRIYATNLFFFGSVSAPNIKSAVSLQFGQ